MTTAPATDRQITYATDLLTRVRDLVTGDRTNNIGRDPVRDPIEEQLATMEREVRWELRHPDWDPARSHPQLSAADNRYMDEYKAARAVSRSDARPVHDAEVERRLADRLATLRRYAEMTEADVRGMSRDEVSALIDDLK